VFYVVLFSQVFLPLTARGITHQLLVVGAAFSSIPPPLSRK